MSSRDLRRGSMGSSDRLDRMGKGGAPVLSKKDSLVREQEAFEALDRQMAEMEANSASLVENLNSTSSMLDAADRAARERIESAAALLEQQAYMLRRKSMEQLDEQIRQYEQRVHKGERGSTPAKLGALKREMSVVQGSGKAVSSGFCRWLRCLP